MAHARLLAVLLVVLAACAHAPRKRLYPLPPEGSLVTSEGAALPDERFLRAVREARFIVVGESHDNPCDHRVQARVVALLASAGRTPAVGLEMVPIDRQAPLDRFGTGVLPVAQLPEALDWKGLWGFDFALYQPIFETAQAAGAPLVALNVPDAWSKQVRDGGLEALSEEQRAQMPPEIVPPPPDQLEQLREAFGAHAHHSAGADAGAAFDRFQRVQSLWDTTMAWRAAEAAARLGRPMVIVAGGGHVEHGWGIPSRLARFAPDTAVLTLMPWRGEGAPEEGAADVFYRCPATKEERVAGESSLR